MPGKRALVYHADLNLVGTLHGFKEATEKGYLYLQYYPLGGSPFTLGKPKTLKKAIHKDHIHNVIGTTDIKGVEDEICLIYSGETGSSASKVFDNNQQKMINELRGENRMLKRTLASSKQREEDARSGVNKAISSMKSVSNARNNISPFGAPAPRPYTERFSNREESNYGGFEDF